MRTITRNLFRILNNEKLLPVLFLEIVPVGVKVEDWATLRFTDCGEDTYWGGKLYSTVTLSRGEVREILSSESGEYAETTLTVSNIDGTMAEILNYMDLAGATATLYLADRRLLGSKRDGVILTSGEIREPQLTSRALVFQIVNVLGMCDRLTVPRRLWQQECNYTFGSRACGINLDKAPYSIEGTVQPGTTAEYLVVSSGVLADAGNPADPSEFWSQGYVLIKDGACVAQACPISFFSDGDGQNRFYFSRPFLTAPEVGATFVLRRGCGKTKDDCKDRGNLLNYGGFEEVPYERFKPRIREDD